MNYKDYIVVIPARKIQKELKENLRKLNGKPLISHSIEYAVKYLEKKYLGKH